MFCITLFNKLKKYFLTCIFVSLLFGPDCLAQINPPGLGITKTAAWVAFAVRQELDTVKKWQSVTYTGISRKSNPDNYDPLFKPAIFIINQEFFHQFHKRWQYSLAVSYRRQHEHLETPPYGPDNPSLLQEFRFYGRFSHIIKMSRIRITPTFRQEIRKFVTPDFENISEDFQLRSRFRLQLTVNLDANRRHNLVAGSEQLFSVSKKTNSNTWTAFKYKDTRLTLYYSFSPATSPLTFNIGYMNNLVGTKPHSAHYIGFDITWRNPFNLRK